MNKFFNNLLSFLFILSVFSFTRLNSSISNAFSEGARGQAVFSILKSPVSPYFFSLGGAGSAVMIEDNIFLNPASMFMNNSNSIFINFQKSNVNTIRTDLAYLRRNSYIVSGFSLSWFDYGDFKKYDNLGNFLGSFSPYDMILSYSYSWGKKERFGLRAKYIESNLIYQKARGMAFDLGFSVKGKTSSLSLLVRNIGPTISFDEKHYSLPLDISAGFDYIYSSNMRGIFDLRFPSDNKAYSIFGIEYSFNYGDLNFKLRGGINTLNFREIGIGGILAGGFGISIDNFTINYSFTPYSNIDNSHSFLLKYSFGEVKYEKEEEYKFREFLAKEISLKKKIVVFSFTADDISYGELVASSIEERLIEKRHSVISRLDPIYINLSKQKYNSVKEIIDISKRMGADYAVWGIVEKKDEIKSTFTMFTISLKDEKIKQYSFISNIYDLRNIALRLAEEVSIFIGN